MKSLHHNLFLVTMLVVASISAVTAAAPAAGADLMNECSKDFQKVTLCLDYATGKAPKPAKQCCDAIQETRERDPKCLCYVIQQAKTGGQALKDLGVQEAKLIQLPTACELKNASISDCPKLLGISPSSPDAAVFTSNATAPTTASPAGKLPASSSTSDEKKGAASAKNGWNVVALAVALIVVSFISS